MARPLLVLEKRLQISASLPLLSCVSRNKNQIIPIGRGEAQAGGKEKGMIGRSFRMFIAGQDFAADHPVVAAGNAEHREASDSFHRVP
ncbi:hypothetical protein ABZP36_030046 [Zizania latifolia]